MLGRFSRILLLVAAAGVAYAGPVAACVCAAAAFMSEMPCCPDEAQPPDQSKCAQPDAELRAACDPVPADGLAAGTHDVFPPIALSAAPLPQLVHGPPRSALAAPLASHQSPPLYLTTLRLRI